MTQSHRLNNIGLINRNKKISDKEWDDYIYFRKNPRGKHSELWHHVSGCRQWFKVLRDTSTHEIFKTAKLKEEL